METHSVLVRPLEGGQFDMVTSTQHMDGCQVVAAAALGIPNNKVNVSCRRIGGGFGGKVTKAKMVAAACAVAANKLKKPVRIVQDLASNMEMMGKRSEYYLTYKATLEGDLLSRVECDIFSDSGFSGQEAEGFYVPAYMQGIYNIPSYRMQPVEVLTDKPTITPLRAPFLAQGHALMETIMEHLSYASGKDPVDLRLANILKPGDDLITRPEDYEGPNQIDEIIAQLKETSNYDARKTQVQEFNQANRWKKRGLALSPLRWPQWFYFEQFSCQVAIFKEDGTVAITHGGIEMGQGLNTKVAQVVAMELGIDMSIISVKSSNNFVGNNNAITTGSRGSELTCSAAMQGCQELLARMEPVTLTLPDDASWLEKVQACYDQGVDLTARGMSNPGADRDGTTDYDIYACSVTEVEVDLLTGEKNVVRVDILNDVGYSISPYVDLGQVEGAFVMGLGLWLTEETKFDPDTGRLLTRDTWEYKPPSSRDIPETFNVAFYNGHEEAAGHGVLSSKTTGEPGVLLGFSIMLALRRAVNEAYAQRGDEVPFFNMDGPATNERVVSYTGITPEEFYV